MAIQMSGKKVNAGEDKITYEVLEECGTLSVNQTRAGVNEKKLRYMSWNGRDPKYDIRKWYVDENGNERCMKPEGGFTGEEIMSLLNILADLAGMKLEKKK